MRSHISAAVCVAVLVGAIGPAQAAPPSASTAPAPVAEPGSPRLLPLGASLGTVASNPYLALGIRAASEGLRTVTVAMPTHPAATLGERINLVHMGLGLAGWAFASQGAVESSGTSTQVLLTYRRQD